VDKPFLSIVAPLLDTSLFPAQWTAKVAGWCVKHFETHKVPPGKDIEAIFQSWVFQDKPDEAEVVAISDFLEVLSSEWDKEPSINAPYLADEFSSYMTERRLLRLQDDVTACLSRGDRIAAVDSVQSFRSIKVGDRIAYKMDKAALEVAFSTQEETLIKFPEEAQPFFNPALVRDYLIGVQAVQKKGKTWWCLEFAYWALRSKKKVIMFETGDLSERDFNRRMAVRMAHIPLRTSQIKNLPVPTGIKLVDREKEEGLRAEVETELCSWPAPLDKKQAYKEQKAFYRHLGITDEFLRFSVHANSSINIKGIDGILHRLENEQDFVPDVVIIDYADILAPEDGRVKESRDKVDDNWRAMRRLAQERHVCVIVPTQANKEAQKAWVQTPSNTANDIRKLAHVNGMMGINQTNEEKKQGVQRLNWIVLRESEYQVDRCLWVANCWPLAQAFVKGTW
jgi:hypothetical protein